MDLTLEILGWVESLEDALTQFTSPEDLDGENMYRCGRYDHFCIFCLYLLSTDMEVSTHVIISENESN
jgi:hypothetical protein